MINDEPETQEYTKQELMEQLAQLKTENAKLQIELADIRGIQVIKKLDKDMKEAAKTLQGHEVSFLVKVYYDWQKYRIGNENRLRSKDGKAPNALVQWMFDQCHMLEKQLAVALDIYTANSEIGTRIRNVPGVGPIMAAGLLAYNIPESILGKNYVSSLYRYAGMDPTCKWEKGKKRPWNANVKVLCYKLGQSFIKTSGNENSYYGQLFKQRKAYELSKNFLPLYGYPNRAQADEQAKRFGKATEAYQWCTGGWVNKPAYVTKVKEALEKYNVNGRHFFNPEECGAALPMAAINMRAARWAVKRFLSDFHATFYKLVHEKDAPEPFPIAKMKEHNTYIAPPDFWNGKPMSADERKSFLDRVDRYREKITKFADAAE